MAYEDKLRKALEEGNPDAVKGVCAEVFEAYKRLVYSITYAILGSPEDAEDATEEAFVAFFSRLSPDMEFRSIKYYLLNSARFIAYKAKKEKERFVGEFPEESLGFHEDVMRRLDELDGLAYLRKALDDDELSLVLEHILEEKTFHEMAEERNVSENSVSSKYKRALDKVRKERRR